MGQLRDRSLHFTPEGIALIEEAMQIKDWDKNQLAEQVEISYESICRYLRGERPPQRKNIEIIAKRLGLKPIDLVNPDEWISSTKASETKTSLVDWRRVSKGMLDNLKRLTTEALTAGDGIRFDFDDVFVPLGVVERQQKTKRKEDDGAPDRGSELYEENVTPITHNEFFEDVLLRGNTKISNGKRIALIGEAGAGKTTQLQKIGSWLLEESDDIPVWISLTDLGAKSLREYLFENWVREASDEIESAPQAWKDSLGDAIKSGKVWLLLDGVDEMTVSNPLPHLSTQLNESWIKNVRVVLTCRVNVWDGGKNALTGFDVYRNLDFDYPDDVYKFIGKWFARAPELAGSLTQALEQSGKERIRDMVKNPLRLTLLCYSWQLKQGELPETKAGLYEWFVEAFYKWNKGKTQIELSRSQEEKLNQALGELAKRAIDGETSRFRLTKTFIENVFREFNIDLFDVALKLNWLNEIGVAAENPLETVYAFYHPSFQEYFAALAINDWDFFLPSNHINRPVKDDFGSYRKYRFFDITWKQVIALWIGRDNILDADKINFINKIIKLEDGCDDLYFYQAISLVSQLTTEVANINSLNTVINKITEQIIVCSFGDYDQDALEWYSLSKTLKKYFSVALTQIDTTRVISSLSSSLDSLRHKVIDYYGLFLQSMHHYEIPYEIIHMADKLGELSDGDELIIDLAISGLDKEEYQYDHLVFSKYFGKSIRNPEIVKTILQILYNRKAKTQFIREASVSSEPEDISERDRSLLNVNSNIFDSLITCLGLSKVCKEEIICELTKIIKNPTNKSFHLVAANSLFKLDPNNKLAILIICKNEFNRISIDCLPLIKNDKNIRTTTIFVNEYIISPLLNELIEQSDSSKVNLTPISLAEQLGELSIGNQNIIDLLTEIVLITDLYSYSSYWSIVNLAEIADKNNNLINLFIELLDKVKDFKSHDLKANPELHKSNMINSINVICRYIIIAFKNNYSGFDLHKIKSILTSILRNTLYSKDCLYIIDCIASIDPQNNLILDKLIEYIKVNGYKHLMEYRINDIFNGNDRLINTLLYCILNNKDQYQKDGFSRMLLQVDINNKIALKQLSSNLCNPDLYSSISDNSTSLICSLNNVDAMKVFISNSNKRTNDNFLDVLWHCAQNMSYPDFYEAWHSQSTSIHPEIADSIPSNNTNKIQTLESQLIDCEAIQEELDRNTDHPEIRCLVVDIRHLEQESDPNVIAKKLTNKFFNSIGRRIPVVQDISCLERELLNLKFELGFEKLAIALYGKSANEAIAQLCQNLTDSIPMRSFTGGQTTQELITQINAWLSEM